MSDIKKRYSGILELDKELWTGRPVFQKPAKPSCKEDLHKVIKWHFIAIAVFAAIVFILGEEFLRPLPLMTLMICGAVCWIASLWLSSSLVLKKFKAEMAEYERVVACQKKIEEVHEALLFQYLDKAMEEYWKESASETDPQE